MKLIVASVIIAFLIPLNFSKPKGEIGLEARDTAILSPVEAVQAPEHQELSIIPITARQHVQAQAEAFGWHEGGEWEALVTLIGNESSWNITAQNPTSTAYGLFQFLDTTWASYGCSKTSDPAEQARCGCEYIKRRYNSPSNALAFWNSQSPNWY